MNSYEPIIRTTQCDSPDFVSILPVELKGAEFPRTKQQIAETLKDDDVNCVRTMLDYQCQAWCVFSVKAGDIIIQRLVARDQNQLAEVLENLFETLTYSPLARACRVAITWPEYSTDHFLFKHLLATGWTTNGLERNLYQAYGSVWDGINLECTFER